LTGAILGSNRSINGFPVTIQLNTLISDNVSYKLSVYITINTTGLIDGRNIAFNVTLRDNESMVVYASDPYPETINVLDAQAHPTYIHAVEGQKLIVVANVTIDPANNSVATYLQAITFNVTPITTLTATYIESFILWKDNNSNDIFDSQDEIVKEITNPTDVNVTFTGLNSLIPAGDVNRYFLTINLSSDVPEDKIYYQVEVLPQNIVISNGTGNVTTVGPFLILSITTLNDSAITYVQPGTTYLAYNITYAENMNDVTGALLKWFNITGMSAGSLMNIVNVTVKNATSGTILGYNNSFTTFPICINLSSLNQVVAPNNATYKLSIYITVNSSTPDNTQIAINAELVTNETTTPLVVKDPNPEIVGISGIRLIKPTRITTGQNTITIKVVDLAGNPLQNSIVTLSGCYLSSTKTTDQNGIASFNVFIKYPCTLTVKATYVNAAGQTLTVTGTIVAVYIRYPTGGGGYVVTPPLTQTPVIQTPEIVTYTPTPTTPTPTTPPPTTLTTPPPTTTTPSPGFEAVFAIAGLLAIVTYLRRKKGE